ncbi:MAG: hypothetical protein L0H94_04235 [Nitrospira sp.]|nr:hypothetical protein [Nitrospira sp.]
MSRILEFLRAVIISPEMLAGCLPFVVSSYWPEPANFAAQQLASDTKWAFSIAAIPLGLLAATYASGSDILSPTGGKKALLAWPDYWKLKMRIVVAFGYCLLGCALTICGVYFVAHQSPVWGGTLAIAGVLCAAAALASVALARLTIREIIPE